MRPDDGILDPVVLDAALHGRCNPARLTRCEGLWLVGELTRRGYTVDTITALTGLSRRTVHRLRARARSLDLDALLDGHTWT